MSDDDDEKEEAQDTLDLPGDDGRLRQDSSEFLNKMAGSLGKSAIEGGFSAIEDDDDDDDDGEDDLLMQFDNPGNKESPSSGTRNLSAQGGDAPPARDTSKPRESEPEPLPGIHEDVPRAAPKPSAEQQAARPSPANMTPGGRRESRFTAPLTDEPPPAPGSANKARGSVSRASVPRGSSNSPPARSSVSRQSMLATSTTETKTPTRSRTEAKRPLLDLDKEPTDEQLRAEREKPLDLKQELKVLMTMGSWHWGGNKKEYGFKAQKAVKESALDQHQDAFVRALECGVNLVDTSEGFGDAELYLAKHLRAVDRAWINRKRKTLMYKVVLPIPFGLIMGRGAGRCKGKHLQVEKVVQWENADLHNARPGQIPQNVIKEGDVLLGISKGKDKLTNTRDWDKLKMEEFVAGATSSDQFSMVFRHPLPSCYETHWRDMLIADTFVASKLRLLDSSLTKQCKLSLQKCKLNYFDLYQLHLAGSPRKIEAWAVPMAKLREDGLIRGIGVSNVNEDQLRRFHAACDKAGTSLHAAQVEFSLLSGAASRALVKACKELNVTVLAHSPLAMGRLTGRADLAGSRPFGAAKAEQVEQVMAALNKVAQAVGKTPAQVALKWVQQKGCIPLTGFSTKAQVDESVVACGMPALSEEHMTALDKANEAIT